MSNEVSVETQYNVIIDSIGTANPSVSSILADALGTPVEIVIKALYNAPSILFKEIEEDLANQTVELLGKLGVKSHSQESDLPLPPPEDPVDIGVYVHDISKLNKIVSDLSEFMGGKKSETLNLLMNDPAIVLGGVSRATGLALIERLDAEVIISEPKSDLYTLTFKSDNKLIQSQLESYLKYAEIPYDFSQLCEIRDLSYETANEIWSKFHSTGMVKMKNQSFQRYEIILEAVDTSNPNYRTKLINEVGMPNEVIDEVIQNLPIQIEASVNHTFLQDKLADYATAGLNCSSLRIKENGYRLIIEENENLEESKHILSQFVPEESLPKNDGRWESPIAVGDLIFRCVAAQLEEIGCTIDYEFV